MNAVTEAPNTFPETGTPHGGGFIVGPYRQNGETRILIIAPKEGGRFGPAIWSDSEENVPGAASLIDGLANTDAMAAAGSRIAQEVRALRIGGFDDWHIPALDQLEIIYRAMKPGSGEDSLWNRSGINLHALPPTLPYSNQPAAQTAVEVFRAGGSEAIDTDKWYWTSTQHAGYPLLAWVQDFSDGSQDYDWKANEYRVLAVRSEIIR